MKKRTLPYSLLSAGAFCAAACSGNTTSNDTLIETNASGNSLIESSSGYSGSRGEADMVSVLYQKALMEDAVLAAMHNKSLALAQAAQDSLAAYNLYMQANQNYWSSVDRNIAQIGDSLLRQSTKTAYETRWGDYKTLTAALTAKADSLKRSSTDFNDQLILLKLAVTAKAVQEYQSAKLPALKPLNDMLGKHEEAILETKAFIKAKEGALNKGN